MLACIKSLFKYLNSNVYTKKNVLLYNIPISFVKLLKGIIVLNVQNFSINIKTFMNLH